MPHRVRVAIAGAGFIGSVHARSARLAGAELVGVTASSPARSQRAAAMLGAQRAFATPEALVTAPDVDVVHICTPNYLHRPLAEAALAAGKHVICEKPLAVDMLGAQALADAAAEAERVAAVPFVYRYYPTVREARERVRSGDGGPVRLIHGSYLQDWLVRPEDDNWRVDEDLGGASRAFADIGSHWCDLAEFVTGHRIVRVCARTMTTLPERARGATAAERRKVETEDVAIVQFETDRGAIGSTVISQVSAGRKNRLALEISTADESFAFDQEEPETLWRGRREGASLIRRDPETLSAAAARFAVLPAGHPQGYADCFDAFVAEVYGAIERGEAADELPQFTDGLRAAAITEAVLCSAREECWIDVLTPETLAVTE